MILQIRIYGTRSGKSHAHGRNDTIKLVAQTGDEATWLESRRKAKLPVSHTGSGNWGRSLEDLREAAKTADPSYKEDRKEFTIQS
jgi:hypothetical protein